MTKLPKPFVKGDIEFLGMVTKRLREAEAKGKSIMHLSIKNCKRLERLAGIDEKFIRGWDVMRDEFKPAYPCDVKLVKARLRMVKGRIRALQR